MKPKAKPDEKPVVQTVKLTPAQYVRLKTFSAQSRRTHQDIFVAALLDYLKKQ